MHIGNLIARHARYRPDHTALVFQDRHLSYAAFARRVAALAGALHAQGVGKGQRIATLLPNCPELVEIYWAAACSGVVVVPLSPMLLGTGLASLLGDSDAVMLFTNNALRPVLDEVSAASPNLDGGRIVLTDASVPGHLGYAALLANEYEAPPVDLCGDDVYNIMYTSGTTGLSKGIVHTHRIRASIVRMRCASRGRSGCRRRSPKCGSGARTAVRLACARSAKSWGADPC